MTYSPSHPAFHKIVVVLFGIFCGAGSSLGYADPSTVCSEINQQIKDKKSEADRFRAEKLEREAELAQGVQTCQAELDRIKAELESASHSGAEAQIRALEAQLSDKNVECGQKMEEAMAFHAQAERAFREVGRQTSNQIIALTRQAMSRGCTHPCISSPGYCYADAPSSGLVAHARTDSGERSGVSGNLFGSCKYTLEIAIGTPFANRSSYCQEYYNVHPESQGRLRAQCASLPNSNWTPGRACSHAGALGACTTPNPANFEFVLRELVYTPNISPLEELKESCIRRGVGIWEYPEL